MDREKTVHMRVVPFAALVILLWVSFTTASQRGMWSSLETQSAQIAREFIESRNFIVPHLNGSEDYEKPALYFWLVAASSLAAGTVSELSSRAPSLIACLLVFAVFLVLKKKNIFSFSPYAAFAIYISSPKVFWMSQVARMDMVFSLLVFAAAASLAVQFSQDTPDSAKNGMTFFYVFAGLAFLCKGPAGFILPVFGALLFSLSEKKPRRLKAFLSPAGIALFLLIALPWYILAGLKTDGRFLEKFFLSDNIGRFLGPSGLSFAREFSKRQPLWFYVPQFLTGFFPWSLIFPVLAALFVRKAADKTPAERFFLSFTIGVFLFFSIAGVKRSDYLLPLYPAAALLTASFLERFSSSRALKLSYASCGIFLSVILVSLFALSSPLLPSFNPGNFIPESDTEKARLVLLHLRLLFPAIAVLFLACCSFLFYGALRQKSEIFFSTLLASCTALIIFASRGVIPVIDRHRDVRPFCREVSKFAGKSPLWFYGFWNDEFVFYCERFISPATPQGSMGEDELRSRMKDRSEPYFFIIRKKDYQRLIDAGIDIPYTYSENTPELYPVYLISNIPGGQRP